MSHVSIVRPLGLQPATVFASPILFLHSTLGRSARQIADAFQISETNVRTILSRGVTEVGDPGLEHPLSPEQTSTSADFENSYGVRPLRSGRVPAKEPVNLDQLMGAFDQCVEAHRRAYDFIGGAAAPPRENWPAEARLSVAAKKGANLAGRMGPLA